MHGMNSTAPAGGSAAAGRMLADNNTSFGLSDGTPSREGSGGSGRNIPRLPSIPSIFTPTHFNT